MLPFYGFQNRRGYMKKLVLISLAMFALSLSAATTFTKYVETDYKSIEAKKATLTDQCQKERYTDMYVSAVAPAKNDPKAFETLKTKVKTFCDSGCKGAEKFRYKDKDFSALVLYYTKEPVTCKGKENDQTGRRWFVDCSECKDITF